MTTKPLERYHPIIQDQLIWNKLSINIGSNCFDVIKKMLGQEPYQTMVQIKERVDNYPYIQMFFAHRYIQHLLNTCHQHGYLAWIYDKPRTRTYMNVLFFVVNRVGRSPYICHQPYIDGTSRHTIKEDKGRFTLKMIPCEVDIPRRINDPQLIIYGKGSVYLTEDEYTFEPGIIKEICKQRCNTKVWRVYPRVKDES